MPTVSSLGREGGSVGGLGYAHGSGRPGTRYIREMLTMVKKHVATVKLDSREQPIVRGGASGSSKIGTGRVAGYVLHN